MAENKSNKKRPSSKKKKLTAAQRRELERQQRLNQLLIIVGSAVVVLIIVIVLVTVINKANTPDTDYTQTSSTSSTSSGVYPASEDYEIAPDGEQLEAPESGEEVAVLVTSMGTIKIRLFEDYAPTTVENFKALINSGYYNGTTFHRVIDDFMIQTGMGTDGSSTCSFEGFSSFADEFDRNLYNIRGAVSMANTGEDGSNTSQFFIVQSTEALWSSLGDAETFISYGGAEWAAEAYEEYGGTPYLDGQFKSITGSGHTVFGQVYEGMDVVDLIAAVETDSSDCPVEDVIIEEAYLETVE